MGEAGHDRGGMGETFVSKRELKLAEQSIDAGNLVSDIEAEVGRHLIVARPRRMQFARNRSDQLGQTALDVQMDVLEGAPEGEFAPLDFGRDRVEPARDLVRLMLGNDAAGGEHFGMGFGRKNIVAPEALVEVNGGVYLLHDRGGAQCEPAAPHGVGHRCRALSKTR